MTAGNGNTHPKVTMTAERWRKVKELYYAANECDSAHRGQFLAEACSGDSELRRDIETLLAQDSKGDILDSPASQLLAGFLSGESLTAGDRLGPYEIIARIGAGGMGEVWKGRDTRLDRLVAIKISREQFSNRFEHEARAIAALNHPHICQIHDIGPDYLVMEFVEGTPLKGPLALDRALTFAAQLAGALDAAHRAGIVHRDLKPGNVLMTKSGVKMLDFGLAKMARAGEGGSAQPVAKDGPLIGTLRYMAPEQLQGGKADQRSDIFAFGCILYEMLTGKQAFDGPDASSVMAAILERETPSVAAIAPAALDRVLRRCLAKDPDERWQSARDLQPQLEWIGAGVAETARTPTSARALFPWLAAVVLIGAGFAGGSISGDWNVFGQGESSPASPPAVRFTMDRPANISFAPTGNGPARISPDGSHLVFAAGPGSGSVGASLWLRRMDAYKARELAGTEGARYPFWSGDSRHVGFFVDGKLRRISIDGGPPQTICSAIGGRGGAWHGGLDGVIVFAPSSREGLWRVAAAGGEPTVITTLDSAHHEISHRVPHFLPDGRHFLYVSINEDPAKSAILASELPSGQTRPVAGAGKRLMAGDTEVLWARRNANDGYLLFVREGNLLARPFDPTRLELGGEPVSVAENIDTGGIRSTAAISASRSGVLVYRNRPATARRLAWLDREGKEVEPLPAGENLTGIALSPDGKIVAGNKEDGNGVHHIWLIDPIRAALSRVTFDARSAIDPVWSPDGKRVAYSVAEGRGYDLYMKDVRGGGDAELLVKSNHFKRVSDWSRDGKWILYTEQTGGHSRIWALPMTGIRNPIPLAESRIPNARPKLSPDGRFYVLSSDETGRPEVYVRTFSPGSPEKGRAWQVSTDGGSNPYWRSDGKELFFRSPGGKLMTAHVQGGTAFQSKPPIELFDLRGGIVTPRFDGQRFLTEFASAAQGEEPLHVVLNWTADRLSGK